MLGSIIPSLSRPQSLDRYAFVENDPINYTDPSGHMRMDIERRKDAASRSYFSANSNCGPLVTCVYNRPGLMVQEIYGWDTETGEFQKRTIYSGGLGPDGTWDFSEISDVTSYGRMGSDPSDWAQWLGTPSAPPIASIPQADPSELAHSLDGRGQVDQ